MQRFNTILFALCAILLMSATVYSQVQIWEADIIDELEEIAPLTTFTVPDNAEFMENINFPPDDEDLDAEQYTMLFPAGIDVTFAGSLTITVNDEDAIGRIQAVGTEANPITMTEDILGNGWGGILIMTDPAGGNSIQYCDISNADDAPTAVVFLDGLGGAMDVSCEVKHCYIHDNGPADCGLRADDCISYLFQASEISGVDGTGILCINAMDDEWPEEVIVNNYIHDFGGTAGIDIQGDWVGWIKNNIVVIDDEGAAGIHRELGAGTEVSIVNNTVIGNDLALDGDIGIRDDANDDDAWAVIENNIVVSCDIGIQGVADGANVNNFDYCLLNNTQNFNPDNINNNVDNLLGDYPSFADEKAEDFHLNWDSPAINAGDDEIFDPDGSRSDMPSVPQESWTGLIGMLDYREGTL